jgi:hypothetical protein
MWEVEGGMKYLYCDTEMRERLQKEWNRPAIWPVFVICAALIGAVAAFIRAVRRTRNQTA